MSGVIQLFDDNIYDKSGNKINSKSLSDKTVGIYFAAKWCSVCVKFTPILVDFYKRNRDKLNTEIIFVSSDHDEDSFDQYYNEMPWLCLKFSERQLKQQIATKFGVHGIPMLVIVNDKGQLITENGRSVVSDPPYPFRWI